MKLIDRYTLKEVERSGVWFRYGKWSILNCGELMKPQIKMFHLRLPKQFFLGWEAMLGDEIIRADTWKELRSHLPKTSVGKR